MTIPDGIFKAYDIRGLYPQELDEDGRRAHRLRLGAAARRDAAGRGHGPAPVVRRSARGLRRGRRRRRRLNRGFRPRAHGDAVLRRRLAGPRRRRHGHRLAQSAAVQRHEARGRRGPAAERRVRASPSSSSAARRSPTCRRASAGAGYERLDLYPAYLAHLRGLVDARLLQALSSRHGRRQRGRGQARPPGLRRHPDRSRGDVLRGRRHLPQPRAQPAARGEQPRDPRAGRGREGRSGHRLGRRRRPLLLHRRARRVRARRLRHRAARRGAAAQASRRGHPLRLCAPAAPCPT